VSSKTVEAAAGKRRNIRLRKKVKGLGLLSSDRARTKPLRTKKRTTGANPVTSVSFRKSYA
jgi:hypothetical protein